MVKHTTSYNSIYAWMPMTENAWMAYALWAFFLLLMPLSNYAQRNCITMDILEQQLLEDPQRRLRMEDYENQLRYRLGTLRSTQVVTVPVIFHIVHNGQAEGIEENINNSLILAQLQQLNDDFADMNSDRNLVPDLFKPLRTNTMIQFCLAQRDPDGNPTTGINRINGGKSSWTHSEIEQTLKPTTLWNRDHYLNFWVVKFTSTSLLGYAQFPGGPAQTDGIVCAYYTIGSLNTPNPYEDTFAYGRTAIHEVGHWFNLRHIWGDSNCGSDLVSDTPVHRSSNSGCPNHPKTNNCSGGPHTEMFMNYMDYVYDECMHMFSIGQGQRMFAELEPGGRRTGLLTSPGCLPECVEVPLIIDNVPIPPGIYQTLEDIYAFGLIESSSEVTFRAGSTIHLLPGFSTQPGCQFVALIEDCTISPDSLIEVEAEIAEFNYKDASLESKNKYDITSLAAYPNPFLHETIIEFKLSEEAEVEMHLFNITGTLATEVLPLSHMSEGAHRIRIPGTHIEVGMWFLRMRTGQEVKIIKIVKVR